MPLLTYIFPFILKFVESVIYYITPVKMKFIDPIKFEKVYEDAIIPTQGTEKSVGLDLYVHHTEFDREFDDTQTIVKVYTGVRVEPPKGYYFEIHGRSSLYKQGFALANNVGIIDPDYRGELIVILAAIPSNKIRKTPEYGSRVAQLILRKNHNHHGRRLEEGVLTETDRGSGGFGSTGL